MTTLIRQLWLLVPVCGLVLAGCYNWPDEDGGQDISGAAKIVIERTGAQFPAGNMPLVDDILRVDTGNIERNAGSGSFSFYWRRESAGGHEATGVRGPEYLLGEGDFGASLTVVVFKDGYSGGILSPPTSLVNIREITNKFHADATLAVTGLPHVGQELEASVTGIDSLGNALDQAKIRFQWRRSTQANPGLFLPIRGATTSTYTVKRGDLGHNLQAIAVYPGHGEFIEDEIGPITTGP